MKQSATNHPNAGRCPRCGAELPADLPPERCPKCLLRAGLATQRLKEEDAATDLSAPPSPSPSLPQPGEQFGHFRIVRLMGSGGMGAVFEAEDVENGRRVALKVLSHAFDTPEARSRFFREGRLAASVNHPNSVYIFGTEEIGGTPVISMELVSGGTLKERVESHGPLPVSEAVDHILQIVAGLEAAQRVGILHRDVKPSNCFVEEDGRVKIGDFGLSISTAIRTDSVLTSAGSFLGTPAFSSPEQLRGDELTLRSDIYAVGVTLYYLLTARLPFEAPNFVQMLATVLERPAKSPAQWRADLPAGLCQMVLRCLEKQPGERYKNYDELRQALAPFSSDAIIPAPLGLRFVAGALDLLLMIAVTMTMQFAVMGAPIPFMNPVHYGSGHFLLAIAMGFLTWILYFSLLEGLYGASVGKAVLRLRVVDRQRNPPGIVRALLRALIVMVLPSLPTWIVFSFSPVSTMFGSGSGLQFLVSYSYYAILALLFCTVRRRNGFAATHDLVSGTRVIRKPAHHARPALSTGEESAPATDQLPTLGPYHVLECLAKSSDGEWLAGFDTRLLRRALIRVVQPGTAPFPAPLRKVGRAGRLRWIAGRRGAEENWDAFEGLTGKPLLKLIDQPQPWSAVRYWLYDLAGEIQAAEKDGTLPGVLALDRIWITADGRAKLLDFPAPGLASGSDSVTGPDKPPPISTGNGHTGRFLQQVACASLEGRAWVVAGAGGTASVPLPLHARLLLDRLPALPGAEAIRQALKPLLRLSATVSALRRAGLVGGCAAFPLLAMLGLFFGLKVMAQWQRSQPEIAEMTRVLNLRAMMNSPWSRNQPGIDDRTFAIYLAGNFRRAVTNSESWNSLYALSSIKGESRLFAEQSLREHPNPTPQEIQKATALLEPHLPSVNLDKFARQPWFPLAVFWGALLMYVGLPALLTALLFRGGLVMRILGLAVVRNDGAPASRPRVFWRVLIAWLPLFLSPILMGLLAPLVGALWSVALLSLLVLVLLGWSLRSPGRGLADRLAGTWLVMR